MIDLNKWLKCSLRLLVLFLGSRLSLPGTLTPSSSASAGSSTACIVVLDRQSHRLHTANLGDSGFLVVRGGEVVHRSDEQQHYFNTPFQLSIAPPGAEGAVLSDRYVCLGAPAPVQRGAFSPPDVSVTANHMQRQERREEHFCNACAAAVLC